MQKAKAVIFDCDGVLIDSEILVCRLAAEEMTRFGYEITTQEVIRRFAGRPEGEMKEEIMRDWGRPVPENYSELINARTVEAYGTELQIMPGMKEALDKITLPVCVASSSYPSKLRLGLETVGLYDRFAPNIISGTSVARGKPEPDVFVFAAGWMKQSPHDCIVVEDSVAGVRAAVRAGMRVFGFTGGSHCEPEHEARLREAGAMLLFNTMQDLPGLIAAQD